MRIWILIFVFSFVATAGQLKKGEHELNMSAHEVSGVDRNLSTAEESREGIAQRSDATHRLPMDWKKRMQQDIEEIRGW